MTLTRDRILAAEDRPKMLVAVPEWGGEVYMATLSAWEKGKWEEARNKAGKGQSDYGHIRASLIQLCAVDAAGERLFDHADIHQLSDKSAAAMDRLFTVALDMNAMDEDDIKELEKNSESGQPEDLHSDSV